MLKININDLVYYEEVSCHVHEWNDDDKGWKNDDKGRNGGMTDPLSVSLSLTPSSLPLLASLVACRLL